MCLEPWTAHSKETGGYYRCNKYSEREVEERKAPKKGGARQERLLFYAIRFENHEQG